MNLLPNITIYFKYFLDQLLHRQIQNYSIIDLTAIYCMIAQMDFANRIAYFIDKARRSAGRFLRGNFLKYQAIYLI